MKKETQKGGNKKSPDAYPIRLGPLRELAEKKANSLGINLASYIRMLITLDLKKDEKL